MDTTTLSNDYNKVTAKDQLVSVDTMKEFSDEAWAHVVTPESCPVLHKAFSHACRLLKIHNPPALIIYKNNMVTGFNLRKTAACISTGTIDQLTAPETLFVISHELGHNLGSRRDFLKKALGIGVTVAAVGGSYELINWSKIEAFGSPLATEIATLVLTAYLCSQLKAQFSQSEEYLADATGADVVGTEHAVSALRRMEKHNELADLKLYEELTTNPSPSKRVFRKAILDAAKTLEPLLPSTHPSFTKRETALRKNPKAPNLP